MTIDSGVSDLRSVLDDPVIIAASEHHGRTPAQVVLRWHVELGVIPIPKSTTPNRLAENIDVFDFKLSSEEVAAIGRIDPGEHRPTDSDRFGH
jgi:2,5-diketo-D-gluconate reductase A